jgi:hypothetical protein
MERWTRNQKTKFYNICIIVIWKFCGTSISLTSWPYLYNHRHADLYMQYMALKIVNVPGWGDQTWTACCRPTAAPIGGCDGKHKQILPSGGPSYRCKWENSGGQDFSCHGTFAIAKTWFSMWKTSVIIGRTRHYGEGEKRNDRAEWVTNLLDFGFAGDHVNNDSYQELLRQHVVSWGQKMYPGGKYICQWI